MHFFAFFLSIFVFCFEFCGIYCLKLRFVKIDKGFGETNLVNCANVLPLGFDNTLLHSFYR